MPIPKSFNPFGPPVALTQPEEEKPKTPAVQTPAVQTPAAQTPTVQTPAAQTPTVQTPTVQTPAAKTPAAVDPEVQKLFGPPLRKNAPETATEPTSEKPRSVDEIYYSVSKGDTNPLGIESMYTQARKLELQDYYHNTLKPAYDAYQKAEEGYKAGKVSEADYQKARQEYSFLYYSSQGLYDAYDTLKNRDNLLNMRGASSEDIEAALQKWDAAYKEATASLEGADKHLAELQTKYDTSAAALSADWAALNKDYDALSNAIKAFNKSRNRTKAKAAELNGRLADLQKRQEELVKRQSELDTMGDDYVKAISKYNADSWLVGDMGFVLNTGADMWKDQFYREHPTELYMSEIGAEYDENNQVVGVKTNYQDLFKQIDDLYAQREGASEADLEKINQRIATYNSVMNTGLAFANLSLEDLASAKQFFVEQAAPLERELAELSYLDDIDRAIANNMPYEIPEGHDPVADRKLRDELQTRYNRIKSWENKVATRKYEKAYDPKIAALKPETRALVDQYILSVADPDGSDLGDPEILNDQYTQTITPAGFIDSTRTKRALKQALLDEGIEADEVERILKYVDYEANAARVTNLTTSDQTTGRTSMAEDAANAGLVSNFMAQLLLGLGSGTGAVENIAQYLGSIEMRTERNGNEVEISFGREIDPNLGEAAPIDFNSFGNLGTIAAQEIDRGEYMRMQDLAAKLTSDKEWQERLSNLMHGAYGLFESMAQSAVIGMMAGAGWESSMLLLSGSAASSTMQEMHQQGYSDSAVVAGGIISGFAEYITEKVSIEHLLDVFNRGELAGLSKTELAKRIGVNLLTQTVAEASEEGASDLINLAYDQYIGKLLNGGLTQIEMQATMMQQENPGMSWKEALEAAHADWMKEFRNDVIGGALSGLMMGAGGFAGGYVSGSLNARSTGKTLLQQGNDAAMYDAVEKLKGSIAAQAAGLNSEVRAASPVQLGRMYGSWMNAKTMQAIEGRLTELGVTDITPELLRGINAGAAGDYLLPGERTAVETCREATQVMKELQDLNEAMRAGKDTDNLEQWTLDLEAEQSQTDFLYRETNIPQLQLNNQTVSAAEAQYNATKESNPDATVMNPVQEDLEKAGMQAKDAVKQGELLTKVFNGELLTGKEMRALDLNNPAVNKVFVERSGLTGVPKTGITQKMKQTYANQVTRQNMVIKQTQEDLKAGATELGKQITRRTAERTKAMQQEINNAQKNPIQKFFGSRKENAAARKSDAAEDYAARVKNGYRNRAIRTEGLTPSEVIRLVRLQSQNTDLLGLSAFVQEAARHGVVYDTEQAIDNAYMEYLTDAGLTKAEINAMVEAGRMSGERSNNNGVRRGAEGRKLGGDDKRGAEGVREESQGRIASSRDLGIPNGSGEGSLAEVTAAEVDKSPRLKLAAKVLTDGGIAAENIHFVRGNGEFIKIVEADVGIDVRGVYDPTTQSVWILADDASTARLSPRQIARHELFHYYVSISPELFQSVKSAMEENGALTEAEKIAREKYANNTGIYGSNLDRYLEEVMGDAFANVNTLTGANAKQFSKLVRRAVEQALLSSPADIIAAEEAESVSAEEAVVRASAVEIPESAKDKHHDNLGRPLSPGMDKYMANSRMRLGPDGKLGPDNPLTNMYRGGGLGYEIFGFRGEGETTHDDYIWWTDRIEVARSYAFGKGRAGDYPVTHGQMHTKERQRILELEKEYRDLENKKDSTNDPRQRLYEIREELRSLHDQIEPSSKDIFAPERGKEVRPTEPKTIEDLEKLIDRFGVMNRAAELTTVSRDELVDRVVKPEYERIQQALVTAKDILERLSPSEKTGVDEFEEEESLPQGELSSDDLAAELDEWNWSGFDEGLSDSAFDAPDDFDVPDFIVSDLLSAIDNLLSEPAIKGQADSLDDLVDALDIILDTLDPSMDAALSEILNKARDGDDSLKELAEAFDATGYSWANVRRIDAAAMEALISNNDTFYAINVEGLGLTKFFASEKSLLEFGKELIQDVGERGIYNCYLNLEHPFVADAHGNAYWDWNLLSDEEFPEKQAVIDYIEADRGTINRLHSENIVEWAIHQTNEDGTPKYDGVILLNSVDPYDVVSDSGPGTVVGDARSTIAVTWNKNTPKSVANQNPTSDPRITYSAVERQNGYDHSKSFSEQIDDYIKGVFPARDSLVVGPAPQILKDLGLPDLPITYSSGHLKRVLDIEAYVRAEMARLGLKSAGEVDLTKRPGYKKSDFDHSFGMEVLKQMPDALAHPVAVIRPYNENEVGRDVAIIVEFEYAGRPIQAAVVINGRGQDNKREIDSYHITTYFRSSYVRNALNKAIDIEKQGNVVGVYYLDNEKAANLVGKAQVSSLGRSGAAGGLYHTLTDPKSEVKAQIENNTNSRQFKNWFRGSRLFKKTSDGGTAPRVMHHTTSTDQAIKGPIGYRITAAKEDGSREVYAKLTRPIYLNGVDLNGMNAGQIVRQIAQGDFDEMFKRLSGDAKDRVRMELPRELMRIAGIKDPSLANTELVKYLMKLGIDGIRYTGANGTEYLLFDANQIKAADNIGLFSTNSDNIRYSKVSGKEAKKAVRRAEAAAKEAQRKQVAAESRLKSAKTEHRAQQERQKAEHEARTKRINAALKKGKSSVRVGTNSDLSGAIEYAMNEKLRELEHAKIDAEWQRKMAESNGEQEVKRLERIWKDKLNYATKTDKEWARRMKQSGERNVKAAERRLAKEAIATDRKIRSLPATAALSNRRSFNKATQVPINDNQAVATPLPANNEADRKILWTVDGAMKAFRNGYDKVYRAMVNAVQEVDRMAKLQTRTDNLSVWVNVVRASRHTINMFYDYAMLGKNGDAIGPSMNETFLCHDENGAVDEKAQKALGDYMFYKHLIDRMSLKQKARERVDAWVAKYQWLETMDAKEFAKEVAEGTPIVVEYARLLQEWRDTENKPVLPDADGNPVTAETAQKVVDVYEAEMPWLVDKANSIYEWWDVFMREWAVGTSITEEQYENMREMYPHYVPTYRVKDGGQSGFLSMNAKGIRAGEVTKRAKGSTEALIPMEDQFVNSMARIVRNNRQNDMLRNLIEEFMFDDEGKFADYGFFDWAGAGQALKQDLWEFADETEKTAVEKVEVNGEPAYHVTCWVDGVQLGAYVNRAMFEGISFLFDRTSDTYKKAVKIGNWVSGPMKTMITGLNPFFALKNIIRDQHTAFTNSQSGLAYGKYLGQAAAKISANHTDWVNFQALGGVSANQHRMEGGFAEAMRDKGGALAKVENVLGTPGEISESVSRFAEYLATLDRLGGDTYENRLKAIRDAAEVTVDFGRRGTWGTVINAWVPYWNPSVQGLDKAIRNIAEQPDFKSMAKRLGRAGLVNVIVVGLQTAILYARGRWDEYEELSDQVKDNYYCFPIGDHKFLKLPKSQDWAAFISTPIMRVMEGVNGRDDPMEGWFESALIPMMPFEMRDPLGLGFTYPVIMPIFMDTALDLKENKNYAGGAIIPYYLQEASSKEQFDADTSLVARLFGEVFKASPMAVDYVIDNYMGNFFGTIAHAIPLSPLSPTGYYTGETKFSDKALDGIQTILSPFVSDNRYSNSTMANYYEMLNTLEQEVTDAGAHGEKKDAEHYKIYQALTQAGGYVDQIRALTTEARNYTRGEEQASLKWEAAGLADLALEFAQKCIDGEIEDPELWMTYQGYGADIMREAETLKKYEDDFNFNGKLGQPKVFYDRTGKTDIKYDLEANPDWQKEYVRLRSDAYRTALDTVIRSGEYKNAKPTEKAALLEEAKRLGLRNADTQMIQYLNGVKATGETIGKVDYSAEQRAAAYSVSWLMGESGAYKPEITDQFVDLYDYHEQYSFIPTDAAKKTFKTPGVSDQVYVLDKNQQKKYAQVYHDEITDAYTKVMAAPEFKSASPELRAAMLAKAKTYANDSIAEKFSAWLQQTGAKADTLEKASPDISLEAKYAVQRALGDDHAMQREVTDELVRLYQYSDVGEVEYFPIATAPKSYVDDRDRNYIWELSAEQREVYMGMMFDTYQKNILKVMNSSQYKKADDYGKAQLLCDVRSRLSGDVQSQFKHWLRTTKAPRTYRKSPEVKAQEKAIKAADAIVDKILGKSRTYKDFNKKYGW